jgi:hypothetical protein
MRYELANVALLLIGTSSSVPNTMARVVKVNVLLEPTGSLMQIPPKGQVPAVVLIQASGTGHSFVHPGRRCSDTVS